MATPDELASLALSEPARGLLPETGATLEQALIAAMFVDALQDEPQARRDLLARVSPAPKPVELSAGEGVARTLADLLQRAHSADPPMRR